MRERYISKHCVFQSSFRNSSQRGYMGIIILIGGASGVGKTTLCSTVAKLRIGIGLKLFHKIQEKAEKFGISRQDKIKHWSHLGEKVFTEDILPFIELGREVFIDMHYAYQPRGGASVAFAKRGFKLEIPWDCTFSTDLARLIAEQDILMITTLLQADPRLIQERQKASGPVLPIETILLEQAAEEGAWVRFNSSLREFRARTVPIRIENIEKPEVTGQWLSNQLDAGN